MNKIKKGTIVGRISYGKDILFVVERVINLNKGTRFCYFKRFNNKNKSR